MKPGFKSILRFILLTLFLVIVVSAYPALAQNDWGKPVRKESPPQYGRTALNQRDANAQRRQRIPNQQLGPARGTAKRSIGTPSAGNLFGVRQAAAVQEFDIQIEGGEEVGAEEIATGEIANDEFDEGDIYYEDEPLTVADNTLGESLLYENQSGSGCDDFCGGCPDCDSGCASCGRAGRQCLRCRGGGMIVNGNGAYVLQPYWQTNPAFSTITGTLPQRNFAAPEFDWGSQFSPYTWYGIRGSSGLGLRGRYWWLDGNANISSVVGSGTVSDASNANLIPSLAGDTVSAWQSLEFDVVDIEFSFEKQNSKWGIETAAGVRYLNLEQSYSFAFVPAAGAARPTVRTQIDHDFSGIGPTLFVKANHPLSPLKLNVFASGRHSVLLGDRNHGVFGNSGITSRDKGQSVVSISELELGLQRVVMLRRFGLNFQLAFVGQFWDGVGNAGNGGVAAMSNQGHGSQGMGLIGGRASLGVDF